ncbi:hypothetical protein C8R47DRAFT_1205146 [Mycena vitilis]|nr:hypothetical protein C8R47DRAFT_1205146 [Mycena vitilis]
MQAAAAPRRTNIRADIAAFETYRTALPYKLEGSGFEYLLATVKEIDLWLWRLGFFTDEELMRRTAFKIGHTSSLSRRQSQYKKCTRHGRVIVWIGFYRVARRYFVERFIHLRLKLYGGRRAFFVCACHIRHREYVALKSVRGLASVQVLVANVLADSREQIDFEFLPRPALNGDFYDFIHDS